MKTRMHVAKKAASAASRATRKADVFLAGRWTAVADEGDAAMLALAGALPKAGIPALLWRPFEDPLTDARCLHLFGAAAEFLPLVEAAHSQGVKVVLSPEFWHDSAQGAANGQDGDPGSRAWLKKTGAWVHRTARGFFTRTPAWQRELFAAVDLLVPNSHVEAGRIARRTKIALSRMRVVPHGVDPRLALADPEPFRQIGGQRDFVLYVGAFEPKNQQLGFLWAMKKTEMPLVLLGDAAPRCDWYLQECRRVGGTQAQFVARNSLSNDLVASAFTACSCLVVGGGAPASERIALKAGASGTPLVLFDGGCGSEYFGQQAVYIQSDDVADIRRGVLAALERKRSKRLAEHVCTYFSWSSVAKAMREVYSAARRSAPDVR